jgi:uncharacterized protein YndB with AHSA1/START domain
MGEVRASIQINAQREAVWDVVTDLPRLGEWITVHEGFEGAPPDSVENGTRFTPKLSVAGKDLDVDWTATEVSEPELLEWQGEGPGGAVRAPATSSPAMRRPSTYISELDPPWRKAWRCGRERRRGQCRRGGTQALERLKRLVEND